VNPAPLLPGGGPDLARRLPEAERAVAGGEPGIDHEAVLVAQPDQQLVPGLLALAETVVDREQLSLAARVGADQDQDAPAVVLEARREVDPIGPNNVDVALGRQVAALPALVLVLPGGNQAAERGRRKAGRIRPEQGRERLLELPRRDTLQVEPGEEFLDGPRAPQVGRQHRRGAADPGALVGGSPVAHPGALDLDRADAGLDRPLRRVAVADETPAPVVVDQLGVRRERNAATSAAIACVSIRRAPSRSTPSSGSSSTVPPGLGNPTTVPSCMAYPPSGDFIHHRGYAASRLIPQIRP
jgi:hypothetical protein